MKSTNTMLLGLLFILVGIGVLIFISGSIAAISVGANSQFNGLITAFVHQGNSEGPVAYALRVASFLQVVGDIALGLVIVGLLTGVAGYMRRN
jgi:hypothetical protein